MQHLKFCCYSSCIFLFIDRYFLLLQVLFCDFGTVIAVFVAVEAVFFNYSNKNYCSLLSFRNCVSYLCNKPCSLCRCRTGSCKTFHGFYLFVATVGVCCSYADYCSFFAILAVVLGADVSPKIIVVSVGVELVFFLQNLLQIFTSLLQQVLPVDFKTYRFVATYFISFLQQILPVRCHIFYQFVATIFTSSLQNFPSSWNFSSH